MAKRELTTEELATMAKRCEFAATDLARLTSFLFAMAAGQAIDRSWIRQLNCYVLARMQDNLKLLDEADGLDPLENLKSEDAC